MDVSGEERPAGFADKGLKTGAVGMFTSIGVGMASTAPAYSLSLTDDDEVVAVEPVAAVLEADGALGEGGGPLA